MKTYLLEPSYKKSLLEYQVYEREVDGVKQRATLEIGWRSGSFNLYVPENESELVEWANGRDGPQYENVQEIYDDYGVESFDDITTGYFMPEDEDDFIEVGDFNYEMNETWDGCWEDWSSNDDELTEEIQEGYDEEGWDYLEENGWEEVYCYYEIHCNPVLTEVESQDKFAVEVEV